MFQDCYILDTVTSGIFVWIGKHCTKVEKVEAMKLAQKFLATNNYPVWTKVRSFVTTIILKPSVINYGSVATNTFWPSDYEVTVVDKF
jgi:hypothetical protein